MTDDPIVDEVRRLREEHAAKFEFDLDRIFDDLKKREQESDVETVVRPPRKPEAFPAERKAG